MGCIPLHPNRMADESLIKDLAANMIMALDKQFDPYAIIGAFEDALDAYEALVQTYNQQ